METTTSGFSAALVTIFGKSSPKRRLTVLLLLLLTLAAGYWYRWPSLWWAEDVPPSPPVPLPDIAGELFYMPIAALTNSGSPWLLVIRLAKQTELVPYHYLEANLEQPLSIEGWQQALQVPLVFNGGQFDVNRRYLGWLKSQGEWISRQRHPSWMGVLLSGPLLAHGEAPGSRIVDLRYMEQDLTQSYRHVMQSMMLIDTEQQIRVRRSGMAACRMVLAQDRQGRILILATQGAVILHDLANWLPSSGLDIVHAMNLDGGAESQLALQSEHHQLLWYGNYKVDWSKQAGLRAVLPTVLAVQSRGHFVKQPAN